MSKKNQLNRVKLIANPGAGKLREDPARLEEVTRDLVNLGFKVDVAVAQPKRNCIPIARKAVQEGYPVVIAMGGDGTIGAVIQGITGSDVRLGIIPAGTANDIAASLGIPEDLNEACRLIGEGQSRALDLGMLSTKETKKFPFFMITAVGLVATVYPKVKNVPEGKLEGIKEAVNLFLNHEDKPKVLLTLDDDSRIEVETMLVLISNTPLVGLKNLVAPEASMEDGLLDISVFPDFSKAELLAYFAQTVGEHAPTDKKIKRYRARKIKIKTDPPLDIAAEGMILGSGTARIKVLPGALNVIAPEAGTGVEKPLGTEEESAMREPVDIPAGTPATD